MEMSRNEKKKIMSSRKIVFAMALICTLLWGTAFPGVKISYQLLHINSGDTASIILLAGSRFFLAGFLCLIFVCLKNRRVTVPKRENIKWIALNGLVQTVLQYILFYIGLAHTTGVKASILTATITFWSVIFARWIFKETITLRKAVGCGIGFLGIILINTGGVQTLGGFHFLGDGLLLLSTISASLGAMISKIASKEENPITVTGYQMCMGGLVIMMVGVFAGGKLTFTSMSAVLIFIYLACASAVAFALWTVLHKYNEPGKIAVYNFLTPIFGTFLSALLLKESLGGMKTMVSLLCVCSGIWIANSISKNKI